MHILSKSLSRISNRLNTFRQIMLRQYTLDVTPPIHRGMNDKLDRKAFNKTIEVLGAKVAPSITGTLLRASALQGKIIDVPRTRSVVTTLDGQRIVLFRFNDEAALPLETKQFLEGHSAELVHYDLELDYDHWTTDDILQSILPEELVEGAPSGFAIVGHIAHLNLVEQYLPYKKIIGQVIIDKNIGVRTVVNKLNTINNKFRVFQMELLAGEPDFIVQHWETNCKFTFDFTKVYWNSRLHTEHARLVDKFTPEDVIADVFAGVGPFAVPAAKKGCGVLANDLNPSSHEYLQVNISENNVGSLVRASCQDGREFIRSVITRALDEPLPPAAPPLSKSKETKAKKLAKLKAQRSSPERTGPQRNRVTQFVMNLPDSAIQFIDAFRGVLSPTHTGGRDLSGIYDDSHLPMVHCYCFTRELELDKAEVDIRQRVEEKLGHSLSEEVSLHHVRSVAPSKEMYCISFRLPKEVAYAS